MITRRLALLVASALMMALAGCGEGTKDITVVQRAISRTTAQPHRFTYTDETDRRKVVVTLEIEDSFRSHLTLEVDGVAMAEQYLVDDAVAVRLRSPDEWNPAEGQSRLGPLLASGDWVVDPAGAPPIFAQQGGDRANITETGENVVLDAVNAFAYARAAMMQSPQVTKLNPHSVSYRPSEDPFRDRVEEDADAGIDRYDAIPLPLPRTDPGDRGAFAPDTRYFRKLSFYIDEDGRVIRVAEIVDFETHPELVKARRRGRPRFLLDLLPGLRKGVGENPVRPRKMSVDVEPAPDLEIELPDDAETASLRAFLEAGSLGRLPGSEPDEPPPGGPIPDVPLPQPPV